MGIKYKCKNCGKLVTFPETPNFNINRHEQLAHMIYSEWARSGLCFNCKREKWISKTK